MNSIKERLLDHAGVRDFAEAMKAKLDLKREQGRGGWHDPEQCSLERLYILLADHVRKGDMVDIGNLAMMIWNRERDAKDKS